MEKISGLFEIHVTVDTDQGYYKLWEYVHKKKDMKLILATSEFGVCKEQYMISKWKNGTYKNAVDRANEIANDMAKEGINVIRIKVESMAHNDGVPVTDDDFNQLLQDTETIVGKPYFEFHAKIDLQD